jgi:hypothetical protein
MATIQYEESNFKIKQKDNFFNKDSILNSDRKPTIGGNINSSKIRKFSSTREPSPLTKSQINNNTQTHTQTNTFIKNKSSLSPNAKLTNNFITNNNPGITSYIHKKTNSTNTNHLLDLKSSLMSNFKSSNFIGTSTGTIIKEENNFIREQPKIFDANKLSVVTNSSNTGNKFNPTKGFPIKNFNEVLKIGTVVSNSNSDRTYMKKMDRLNKMK